MALRLNGQTTGYTELNAPANGDSVILTMPGTDGNAGEYLQTDGSGGLSWATVTDTNTNLTAVTHVDATSGSTLSFTNIPTNVRRITISAYDLSTSGSQNIKYRLGTGGSAVTSGYHWTKMIDQGGSGCTVSHTSTGDGFEDFAQASGCVRHGSLVLTWVEDHIWVANGQWGRTDVAAMHFIGGHVDVGGAVNMVEIALPSDTFDAGAIGLSYEV